MRLGELTDGQRAELKQALLLEREESVSFDELCNCEELVTDEELEAKWGDCNFTEDDFSCSAADETEQVERLLVTARNALEAAGEILRREPEDPNADSLWNRVTSHANDVGDTIDSLRRRLAAEDRG